MTNLSILGIDPTDELDRIQQMVILLDEELDKREAND